MKKILIINYQSIFHPGLKESQYFDPINSVFLADFMAHLKLLNNQDIPVIDISEIEQFKGEEAIVLTFDSGYKSDIEIVFPLLVKHNLIGAFFPSLLNVPESSSSWKNYQEFINYGFTVGSHGISENYMNELTNEEQFLELKESKDRIEDCLKSEINFFSLPGGKLNDQTESLARSAGYKSILCSHKGLNYLDKKKFTLRRWDIQRKTTLKTFSEMIFLEDSFFRWRSARHIILSSLSRIIGNYHSDRLNYYMHKL